MNLYNAQAGKLEGLSHHPSIPFCDFELSLVSVKILQDVFVDLNADAAAAFVLRSQSEQRFTSETELMLCLPIASGPSAGASFMSWHMDSLIISN